MPEALEEAREVIADLHRIVTPNGVQENCQLRAGGVDHWVYARGRDRSNPVILFVHGGPKRSPTPSRSRGTSPTRSSWPSRSETGTARRSWS
ncbi:hypothetical protein ABZX12_38630 [Kribbella sp. NPDC003505]|uniref:hypothetical protein n=1 Tax=Kribbella sp. NPDC003505 TaxID=3154448 RepID=UPI0033B14998